MTIKTCLFLFFGGVLILSSIMAGSTMLEQRAARDAYSDIRDIRQQTHPYTGVIASKKNVAESEDKGAQMPPVAEDPLRAAASDFVPMAESEDKDAQIPPVAEDPPRAAASDFVPTAESEDKGAQMPPVAEDPPRAAALDFAPLQEINTEIVAWLVAEGTPIDYPVLHTDNNRYYLNHLYTGESNKSGSLFVDYRNTELFTERNTVIYGHCMNNNTMLGPLKLYKEQDFYDEYPTMLLYTPEGDYLIELICGTVEDGNYEFVQFEFADEDAFIEYVDARRSRSTFQSNVELRPGDRIISLCTCSYERHNARYMIIGRLVPLYQTQDMP